MDIEGGSITIYRKPPHKSWSSLDALFDRKSTKTESGGADGEYEMRARETGAV